MTLFGQYFSCTPSQRGCRTRLSIRWQDPNNNTDTETRCLVYLGAENDSFFCDEPDKNILTAGQGWSGNRRNEQGSNLQGRAQVRNASNQFFRNFNLVERWSIVLNVITRMIEIRASKSILKYHSGMWNLQHWAITCLPGLSSSALPMLCQGLDLLPPSLTSWSDQSNPNIHPSIPIYIPIRQVPLWLHSRHRSLPDF